MSRSAHARAIAGALGLALVIAGPTAAAGIVKSLPARAAPTASSQTAAGAWEPWSAKRVEELREAARPVLIDFTARWCLTCQVNERIALENGAVKKRIAAMDVATLRADWTDQDPDIAKALAGYGRASVPLYVLYFPGIPDPILLPELLTPGAVLGALDKAGRIPPS